MAPRGVGSPGAGGSGKVVFVPGRSPAVFQGFQDLGRRDSIDMKRFGKSVFFVTFIALVTAFFAGTAMAVGYTWDNDSGNGMWKDVTNWNPNGDHPGNGLGPVDTATFDASAKDRKSVV